MLEFRILATDRTRPRNTCPGLALCIAIAFTAISDHTNPRACFCRAADPRDISLSANFTSSDTVGSKTPAARCARPIVAVNADFYALRNSKIFTCHLVVSLTGLKVPIGLD
jgi:hypothetical protein